MKSIGQFCFAAILVVSFSSAAHHAFTPVYDGSRTVSVTGVVADFRLVNPHAQMELIVTDEAGDETMWEVEFAGRVNLTNYGWNDDTISVGEHVTVTGNPTHTNSPRMFFVSLTRDDGSQINQFGSMIQSLEDQRRRRREQRRQQ